MTTLDEVQTAANKVVDARNELTATIRQVRDQGGVSLREIAAAANMSHEQVRRILAGA